jgi:hypothetical protein
MSKCVLKFASETSTNSKQKVSFPRYNFKQKWCLYEYYYTDFLKIKLIQTGRDDQDKDFPTHDQTRTVKWKPITLIVL